MQLQYKLDLKSLDKLIASLKKSLNVSAEAAAEGLQELGDQIIDVDSYAQVPKVTGTLADSRYAEKAVITSGDVVVRIGYGGTNDKVNPATGKPASSYMVAMHERLGLNHPDGKAKFLEDPVNQAADRFNEVVGNRMSVVMVAKGEIK